MKVFVSHSMKDQTLLSGIRKKLKGLGIELLIAEHHFDVQDSISEKVKGMIEKSHLGLVLLTKHGLESGFVREEIGFLEARHKPSLVIIEKGMEKSYSGFKYGGDFIELDPDFPQKAVEKVKQILLEYWNRMLEARRQAALQEEARKSRDQKNALVALGIFAGVLILGSSD